MKMPKLQKVKESGNAFFNRLSLNIFGMPQKRNNQPDRVTIQSSHISTISSLVDKTKTGTFTYDTKKENYGLYALKCNRNAVKQGVLMNVNSESNFHPTSRAQQTSSSTDVNHEVFSPCDSRYDTENNLNSIERYHEYYKIEFSEERGLETSVIDRNANISNNHTSRIECNRNGNTSKVVVPPPRPKKKLLSHTTPTVNGNSRKCSTSTKPILNNERLLKNCQKNHLSSACSIEPELSSDNHSRKLSYGENELSTKNADSSKKRNDSALYRIVQAESILNHSDRNHVLCHAGPTNSKMIAIDQYSSIDSGKSYLV